MQKYDQFRSFFPGHASADQRIEESNRKRSQVSSNSQSQDFMKSQSTHFHSSLSGGSTGDSQASFTNQYNDMLASSRFAENKEMLEALLKRVASLTSLISTQQTALSSYINLLHSLMKAVNEIKDKQEAQDKFLMDLKMKISEQFSRQDENYARIDSRFHLKQNFAENEVETSSQDGMSLSAYFSSRTRRGRTEGATEGRASSQASLDLSLTPTAELTGKFLDSSTFIHNTVIFMHTLMSQGCVWGKSGPGVTPTRMKTPSGRQAVPLRLRASPFQSCIRPPRLPSH